MSDPWDNVRPVPFAAAGVFSTHSGAWAPAQDMSGTPDIHISSATSAVVSSDATRRFAADVVAKLLTVPEVEHVSLTLEHWSDGRPVVVFTVVFGRRSANVTVFADAIEGAAIDMVRYTVGCLMRGD